MYVVYKKTDGSILASGQGTPLFAEDKHNGVLICDDTVHSADLAQYKVEKGGLKKVKSRKRSLALSAERLHTQRAAMIHEFWSNVDRAQEDSADAASALTILGELVLGKRGAKRRPS